MKYIKLTQGKEAIVDDDMFEELNHMKKICKVEGCDHSASCKKHGCKGYCNKHYLQMSRYGKILERTINDRNEIIDCGDYVEIILYKKNQEKSRAKIDKEDVKKIKNYKWRLHSGEYIINENKNKKIIYLHQLILGKKKHLVIDHINHDPKDNRKQNLRHCTRQQNNMNRKNARGYHWHKRINKWSVQICIKRKRIHLGYFIKEKDAIKTRRKAELKYFGEFACNNK